MFVYIDQCQEQSDAPAPPSWYLSDQAPQVLPRPHPLLMRDYRSLFDAQLIAELEASAQSGAALEQVAPISAPAHESSGWKSIVGAALVYGATSKLLEAGAAPHRRAVLPLAAGIFLLASG